MPLIHVISNDNISSQECRKPFFQKNLLQKTWKFNERYNNSLVYFASSRNPSIQRCVHILSQLSVSKKRYMPEKKHKFVLEELASWIDCLGVGFVFTLKCSIHLKLILQHPQQSFPEYNLIIVHLCMNCCADSRMWLLHDEESLLPEIVFKNITPRNVITSSVFYLVRF